jgi:hypothetical protein
LESLIKDLNHPSSLLARKVLDDFWINLEGTPEITDETLIAQGSAVSIEKEELCKNVKSLLRNHRESPVVLHAEQRSRQSFDDLLDFFMKLNYYLEIGLVTKKELLYFKYYLRRCITKAHGAVLGYAYDYGYYDSLKHLMIQAGLKKIFFTCQIVIDIENSRTANSNKKATMA